VSSAVDDPWAVVTPRDVQGLLAGVSIRWWVAGGWALDVDGELPHGDIDVVVLRPEHTLLRAELAAWDLRIAHDGALRPWTGGSVGPPENGVWGRPDRSGPWHVDFKIEIVDEDGCWVYRRDPAIRRPLDEIGVVVDGIPFFAPELARLYRSGGAAPPGR
jgi:hypothetical protein